MNVMRDKMLEAIDAKNNDIKSFIWKFAKNKSTGAQEEIRLIDATEEQLNSFYKHCMSMLYSKDKTNPGRYTLLDIIKDQREKCNVELYLRKLKEGAFTGGESYPRHLYCQDVLNCIKMNKEHFPQSELKNIPITAITGGVPKEFSRLSIDSVINGCLDTLGIIDTKHITFNFILNLGIYLTPEEMREFDEKDKDGKTRSKLEVIKERLNIKPTVRLIVKPSGLNYTELRAMLNLRPKKYSELTTDQLVTLRNKVLFRLEQEVDYHITSWEERIRQIKMVAESKGITLHE